MRHGTDAISCAGPISARTADEPGVTARLFATAWRARGSFVLPRGTVRTGRGDPFDSLAGHS